jgi:hypothetical protein
MKISTALCTLVAAFTLVTAVQSAAAPILLINSDGLLTGAKGVSIGGALYDVAFIDGTCASVFSGCDNDSDFAFSTSGTAETAAQALLDQVFIDGSAGNFDSMPEKTFGCGSAECYAFIPISQDATRFTAVYAGNIMFEPDITFGPFSTTKSSDYTNLNFLVFAKFELAATPIPEPSSIFLMGLAMAGLAFSRRRKS